MENQVHSMAWARVGCVVTPPRSILRTSNASILSHSSTEFAYDRPRRNALIVQYRAVVQRDLARSVWMWKPSASGLFARSPMAASSCCVTT